MINSRKNDLAQVRKSTPNSIDLGVLRTSWKTCVFRFQQETCNNTSRVRSNINLNLDNFYVPSDKGIFTPGVRFLSFNFLSKQFKWSMRFLKCRAPLKVYKFIINLKTLWWMFKPKAFNETNLDWRNNKTSLPQEHDL